MNSTNDRCPFCPVPHGLPCILGQRGRCELIEQEAKRKQVDPNADQTWTNIALQTANVGIQPPPPVQDHQPDPDWKPFPVDPELPPLWSMAKGLLKDVARHFVNGMPKASDATYERRMSICKGCDHLRSDGRCGGQGGCGCGMEIKASWALTQCPLGKW